MYMYIYYMVVKFGLLQQILLLAAGYYQQAYYTSQTN